MYAADRKNHDRRSEDRDTNGLVRTCPRPQQTTADEPRACRHQRPGGSEADPARARRACASACVTSEQPITAINADSPGQLIAAVAEHETSGG